jgi:hypothetical protein
MGNCFKKPLPVITEEEALYILSIQSVIFWTNPMYQNILRKYRHDMDVLQELEKSTRLAVKKNCAEIQSQILDYGNSESVKLWRIETAIKIRDELLEEFSKYEQEKVRELTEKHGELKPENHGYYWKTLTFHTNVKNRIIEKCRSFVESSQFLTKEEIYEFFYDDLEICQWKFPERYKEKMEEHIYRLKTDNGNLRVKTM